MRLLSVEFGDNAAVPDARDQVVLADHTVAVVDKILQQVEDLRLNRDKVCAAPQFAPIEIEAIVFEQINHAGGPPRHVSGKTRVASRQIKATSKTSGLTVD